MPHGELQALLAEQTAYYRARASEYDRTSAFDAVSRAELVAALEAFAPRGRVLELACGTGEWTVELVKHASQLTAVDSSPEMLALNHERVAVPMSATCKPICSHGRRRSATTSSSSRRGYRTCHRSALRISGRS